MVGVGVYVHLNTTIISTTTEYRAARKRGEKRKKTNGTRSRVRGRRGRRGWDNLHPETLIRLPGAKASGSIPADTSARPESAGLQSMPSRSSESRCPTQSHHRSPSVPIQRCAIPKNRREAPLHRSPHPEEVSVDKPAGSRKRELAPGIPRFIASGVVSGGS